MKDSIALDQMNLPPVIQRRAEAYLETIARADDIMSLKLATERAAGFVEGLEAARALTPATIEALFLLFDEPVQAGSG